jgi:2,5-furandicarboxylate decarboxylase 1
MTLRKWVEFLKGRGRLLSLKDEFSPQWEIPAVLKLLQKRRIKKGVLFERIKGYEAYRIVGNLFLDDGFLNAERGNEDLITWYEERRDNPIPPVSVEWGPVKEKRINGKGLDLKRELPALVHHEEDAGPYLTSSVIIAKDPETGRRGMGIHRVQLLEENRIRVFIANPPISLFIKKAEELKKPLEIAIVNGLDPVTLFSSIIPLSEGDKFALAGALRGEALPLVKAETVDLEVPAEGEIVLEGVLYPDKIEIDGPFGENTGYYFTNESYVGFIKALTRRKDPIYHVILPFSSEVENLINLAWQLEEFKKLKKEFNFVKKVRFYQTRMLAVVQIQKESNEQVSLIMEHLLDQPIIKGVIVVDEDVDVNDLNEIFWALITRVDFEKDIFLRKEKPGSPIDPMARSYHRERSLFYGLYPKITKIVIDATKPIGEKERFKKVRVPSHVIEKIKRMLGIDREDSF